MEPNNTETIFDDGGLNCGADIHGNHTDEHSYLTTLKFNLTNTTGYWVGKWDVVPGLDFPDTLVDVGAVNATTGQYAWVLEFQCVQRLDEILFIGVNFYSSLADHTYLEEMKAAATARGLDPYIYPATGPQLTLVDQTGCLYNNTVFTEEMPNQETADAHIFQLRFQDTPLEYYNKEFVSTWDMKSQIKKITDSFIN